MKQIQHETMRHKNDTKHNGTKTTQYDAVRRNTMQYDAVRYNTTQKETKRNTTHAKKKKTTCNTRKRIQMI